MNLNETLKKSVYAVVLAFFGLIIGIWASDLLYGLILKGMERTTARYISVMIITLFVVAAFVFGFAKGKSLLE